MFCGCALSFGDPPNTHTCPVCLACPAACRSPTREAIHFGLMIGMALGCELAPRSIFHRKNYFYPDLPKAYQISQYDEPLCLGGRLGDVRIHRVHLEEDAAKLVHVGGVAAACTAPTPRSWTSTAAARRWPRSSPSPTCATRRAGRASGCGCCAPRCARSASATSTWRRARCAATPTSPSARSAATELGTKTELKNMNSFRFIERGIRAEVARQEAILRAGGQVEQETLHFDPRTEAITSLRSKEEAHDYRYFPEPDLMPVAISQEMLDARAGGAARAAAGARRALRARAGPERRSARACSRSAPSWATTSRRRSAATAPTPQPLANWLANELSRAWTPTPTRRESKVAPARWPSWWRWSRPSRSRRAARARCSTSSSPTAAIRRDRRGRGPRRGRRQRRARADRRRRRWPPTPTSPRSCAAAT